MAKDSSGYPIQLGTLSLNSWVTRIAMHLISVRVDVNLSLQRMLPAHQAADSQRGNETVIGMDKAFTKVHAMSEQ